MRYNIFTPHLRYFLGVVFAIISLNSPAMAQRLTSKTLSHNIEKFKQYCYEDESRAYDYASKVVNDLDSTVVSDDAAMVYDFMAEYSEFRLHRYSDAQSYRERAYHIYDALNDDHNTARCNALLSRIYLRNRDYHSAFSRGMKALEDGRTLGDSTIVREAYLTLEQVDFFYHQNKEQAMKFNLRVAESYDGRDQAHQTVRALNNRFQYDISRDEMNEIITRSVALCEKYGFNDLLVNIYLNAGMQEFMFGDYEASADYLNMAKPLLSNFKEEGYYYSAMGFYHMNMGNTEQAIADLRRSVELLEGGDFDAKNVHSYFLLQDIYYNEGRYREAYETLMSFSEIYTRLHNSRSIVDLSLLINDIERQQAEQERLRLEEENRRERELHLKEIEHNKVVTQRYILSVIVAILAAILLYSRYRLERKNRALQRAKAEQELSYKNEIIKIQKLQQYQEQNNVDKLVEELNAAMNIGDSKEMRAELRRIIRQLQSSATSGDWAEVEKTLADGNDTFYESLLREYPNLTKNERKLCLFIHMKMSTKDISAITHQSIGSINVARARLRQKFGLTGDDKSLIAFLDKFQQ